MMTIGLMACTTPAPDVPPVRVAPTATGLLIVQDGREIGFGRDWTNVRVTMVALFGPPLGAEACAGGGVVTRWPGGLALRHSEKTFLALGCPGA